MKIGQLLLSPKGKINRKEFLLGFILAYIIVLILIFSPSIADHFYPKILSSSNIAKLLTALCYLSGIVVALYCALNCLGVKRLRDMGMSPWWILLTFVPFVNVLTLLLFIYPGKKQNALHISR